MHPIGKVEKMSTEFFKNSDDSGILMEFFKNFDQNTGGKLQWQIHQMILEFLKHFDQNSVRNSCCLFSDQNSSLKKTFLKNYAPYRKS